MRAARDATARRRRTAGTPPRPLPDARLAAGPGLVAAAFGITRADTGLDLCDPSSPLRLEAPPADPARPEIVATPRVGISYAGEPWVSMPWRLVVAGSPSLSGRSSTRGGAPATR
jgi:DNA-3-methyladenine glycosylase